MGTADSTSMLHNSGSPASNVASSLSATLPTVYHTNKKSQLFINLSVFI
jgi:hypothetical protein